MITGGADYGWLSIKVDDSDIDRLVQNVLSPRAMKRVQVRAINETTAWLRNRLLRELPSLTGIPRKILSNRVRQGKAKANIENTVTGKVWLGTKPVDAMALKDEGSANTGYITGGYYFEGGFKAFYKGKNRKGVGIYARDPGKSKVMTPSPYAGKSGKRLMQPMKRQNVRIDHFVDQAVRRMIAQAEHQLSQKTARLINFELEKAAR